jgi:hypothetical protein
VEWIRHIATKLTQPSRGHGRLKKHQTMQFKMHAFEYTYRSRDGSSAVSAIESVRSLFDLHGTIEACI